MSNEPLSNEEQTIENERDAAVEAYKERLREKVQLHREVVMIDFESVSRPARIDEIDYLLKLID